MVIRTLRRDRQLNISGGDARRETPVPIPNTMVKTDAADNTWLETAREDRWLPDHGGLAQLGERLPCKQEVTSSNLVFSTQARAWN